jgi:hypothetical protein
MLSSFCAEFKGLSNEYDIDNVSIKSWTGSAILSSLAYETEEMACTENLNMI